MVSPFEFLDEPLSPRSRLLRVSEGEDLVTLACVVLTVSACDGQIDGRSDYGYHTGLCIASYANVLYKMQDKLTVLSANYNLKN